MLVAEKKTSARERKSSSVVALFFKVGFGVDALRFACQRARACLKRNPSAAMS